MNILKNNIFNCDKYKRIYQGRRGKIDTGTDFITPEFLNVLFFQQKNLVIYPYVDLKHLHALEIFTVGHNIVDLESTALHNLREILEFESTNSYSQAPSLYFIYNLDKSRVKEVMSLDNIRCVLNASENVSELVNGSKYVFFNKKSNQFLNLEENDLSYEEYLINNSGNKEILQDQIQKIKIIASKIFTELNQNSSPDSISNLLQEFDRRYWKKILDFTKNYFDIEIPEISQLHLSKDSHSNQTLNEKLKDFSEEYNILVSTNKNIGKEFIQLLHDYRSKKVNPSHLGLEQLFNPMELYNYLRNHHWKEGIPDVFVKEWSKMKLSQYQFNETDLADFELISRRLGLNPSVPTMDKDSIEKPIEVRDYKIPTEVEVPSVKNFPEFKLWVLNNLDKIEASIGITSKPQHFKQTLNHSITTEQSQTNNKLVVDLTNILYEDLDKNEKLKAHNILSIRDTLLSKGYNPFLIVDASTIHKIDDEEHYKMLGSNDIIYQAPARRTADKFVLKCAKNWNCKFLTNDQFKEYWDEFGKDWVLKNRVTCMFIEGELILD